MKLFPDEFTCPGKYKCNNGKQCLPLSQLCDGHPQCPEGDDEFYCSVVCPHLCTCSAYSFNCRHNALSEIPLGISDKIRKLDLSHNDIEYLSLTLGNLYFMIELNISYNFITEFPSSLFTGLNNLLTLDVSFNQITHLQGEVFGGLTNLVVLNIHGNNIKYIIPSAFDGMKNVAELNLANQFMNEILDYSFIGLENLRELDLSGNRISKLYKNAFGKLLHLERLDLTNNALHSANVSTFQELSKLKILATDHFKFCCMASQVPAETCLPPADEISSCEDLMRNNVLRAFLWLIGCMSFLGNCGVIIIRLSSKLKTVHEVLIFNLGISDFLMGVYMICIGVVDIYYRGVYIEHADEWKHTALCNFLGFLATASSEGSVIFLCVISVDRLINITLPFTSKKLDLKRAKKTICICWLIGITLAVIPFFPIPYFDGKFYSRSGVCLALPLTKEKPVGWEYSAAVFVGLNTLGCLIITGSYGLMYHVISGGDKQLASASMRNQVAIARKMVLVVSSDMICWFPIIILGKVPHYTMNIHFIN